MFLAAVCALGISYWTYFQLFKRFTVRWKVYILFTMRTIVVFLLLLLLSEMVFSSWSTRYEKPLLVIAVDHSLSVKKGVDSAWYNSQLPEILNSLQNNKSVECKTLFFGERIEPLTNNKPWHSKTNFHDLFSYLDEDCERPCSELLVISDGIITDGEDPRPEASKQALKISCIGLGDTTQYPDAWITQVICNATAKTQNTFNIEAEYRLLAMTEPFTEISLWEGKKLITAKSIQVPAPNYHGRVHFSISESEAGIHNYTVKIKPINNEQKQYNNSFSKAVQLVDTRLNLILVYETPHPDIPVLLDWLRQSEGASCSAMPWNKTRPQDLKNRLVVFHGLENPEDPLITQCKNTATPYWLMCCNQQGESQTLAEVRVNPGFNRFRLSEPKAALNTAMEALVYVSTSSTITPTDQEQVLNADVNGRLVPVLFFSTVSGQFTGHILIDGIWKWNLKNQFTNPAYTGLRELFVQTFQFSAMRMRKDLFNLILPLNATISDNLKIQAELYDRLYNPVLDAQISVQIKSNAAPNKTLNLRAIEQHYEGDCAPLNAGSYSYTATAKTSDTSFVRNGNFQIQDQWMELQSMQADFALLRKLSAYRKGSFFIHPTAKEFLTRWRSFDAFQPVAYPVESEQTWIDFKFIALSLIILWILEWVFRKKWLII